MYLDQKTNTKYKKSHNDYGGPNVKYLYLERIPGGGPGPLKLQFSYEFFDELIIRGEFIKLKENDTTRTSKNNV